MRPISSTLILAAFISIPAFGYDHPLESVEWTVINRFNANDFTSPRVLLIGDSICNAYGPYVRDELSGVLTVSYYSSSKCITDHEYLRELALVLAEYDYAAIHINNGLHSLNTPPGEWETSLRQTLEYIRKTKPRAKIIWCSATPLKDESLTQKVEALNRIGEKIAKDFEIPTDDLFTSMCPLDRSIYWKDVYHFTENGNKLAAVKVARAIRDCLAAGSRATDLRRNGTLQVKRSPANSVSKNDTGRTSPNGAIELLATCDDLLVYPARDSDAIHGERVLADGCPGQCAKIVTRQDGTQMYFLSPSLKPGSTYLLSFRAKALGTGSIRTHLRTQVPPYQIYGDFTVKQDDSWREFGAVVETPKDYDPKNYALFFNLLSPGTYWIGNIHLAEW